VEYLLAAAKWNAADQMEAFLPLHRHTSPPAFR